MRTTPQKTASQIALRDCSKAAVGESPHKKFWWRGSSIPWRFLFLKTSNYLKTCPPDSLEQRMPHSTLNSLGDCWRSAAWGSISIEADGKCLHCSVIGNALGKCQCVVDTWLPLSPGSWCSQRSVCALQVSVSQPCVCSSGFMVG